MTDTTGATMELDDSELTLGDLEDVEVALGYPLAEATERPGGQLRLATAMIWLRRRKLDPTFTFDQARQLPLSTIQDLAGADVETDVAAALTGAMRPPAPPSMTA